MYFMNGAFMNLFRFYLPWYQVYFISLLHHLMIFETLSPFTHGIHWKMHLSWISLLWTFKGFDLWSFIQGFLILHLMLLPYSSHKRWILWIPMNILILERWILVCDDYLQEWRFNFTWISWSFSWIPSLC